MRTKFLSIDDARDFLSSPEPPFQTAGQLQTYTSEKVAKAVLRVAMERDLTDRQRECVTLYYVQGLTLEQVGERLGIGKSVVYRHLQKARSHLERALAYAQAIQQCLEEE